MFFYNFTAKYKRLRAKLTQIPNSTSTPFCLNLVVWMDKKLKAESNKKIK